MTTSNITNSVYLRLFIVVMMIAITDYITFRVVKQNYEPDDEHKAWLWEYDSLDRGSLDGYPEAGVVFLNKNGGLDIYGWTYGFDPKLKSQPEVYCDEIKRRWERKGQ